MRPSTNNSENSMAESRFLGSLSAASIRNLLQRSLSSKHKTNSNLRDSRSNAENTSPSDPNIATAVASHGKASPFIAKESCHGKASPFVAKESSPSDAAESQAELVQSSEVQTRASVDSDPPVKVIWKVS